MKATPTNREELHDLLVELLGNNHVYYDPPETVKMKYPAIVYHKNHIVNRYAGGTIYNKNYTYTVTLIDENPDSEIIDKILELPFCKHNQNFTTDGMHHDVFTIKY